MGKRSRKSKAKKSDFQKVKLKVGKKRPLPSNVTDIAFKSQAIYIPEQMKNISHKDQETDGDVTEYKKNIPELLGQVGHFNPNFRTGSLTSLRNYFANNRHLIQQHLPKIVEKVPRTIADEDQNVRKSSISFFKILFSSLTEQEITPFCDIILSHLYCAMSHIHDDVQRDSLQIVDLFIGHFPQLLSHENRNMLLQHFIELISTKQTRSAASLKGSKQGSGTTRILSMKMSNKESSITWRSRVLQRLLDLLCTEDGKKLEEPDHFVKFWEHNFQPGKANYDPINGFQMKWNSPKIQDVLTHFESQKLMLPSMSLRSNPMSALSTFKAENETSSPWDLIKTLFPLLFDCWHEATSDNGTSFGVEAAATMDVVLKIINNLQQKFIDFSEEKLEAISQIREAYMNDFHRYFLSEFPFSERHARPNKAKKRKLDTSSAKISYTKIRGINLSICRLVTSLTHEKYIKDDSDILSAIAQYLSLILLSPDGSRELDSKTLQQSILTTKQLVKIAVDETTRENLLRPLLLMYQNPQLRIEAKYRIMKFFVDLYSSEKEVISSRTCLDEWLRSLPDFLIESLSGKIENVESDKPSCFLCADDDAASLIHLILSCIRLACVRKNRQIFNSVKALTILEILSDIMFCDPSFWSDTSERGSGCRFCKDFQARIFEILVYHSPEISENHVAILSKICHKSQIDPINVCYAAGLFVQRFKKRKTTEEFIVMMKFLCSVLIGISREGLLGLHKNTTDADQSDLFIKIFYCDKLDFERHSKIVDTMCLILPTIEHMSPIMLHFLCKNLLVRNKVLPAKSAYAILKAGEMLLNLKKMDDDEKKVLVESLGSLSASILLYCHDDTNPSPVGTISETMSKTLRTFFKRNAEVLRSLFQHLNDCDFQKIENCKAGCSIIQNFASDTNLHETLLQCKAEISQLLQAIKDQGDDVTFVSLYETTFLRVSFFLR